MSAHPLPESLRRTVESDLEPVRPLLPPWQRVVAFGLVTLLVGALAIAVYTLRTDLASMPAWVGWGGTLLELVTAMVLVGLALREAVPGAAPPRGLDVLAVGAALVVHCAVCVLTWLHSPGMPLGPDAVTHGVACFTHDTLLALPTFLLVAWLIARAMPHRAAMAGLLSGAGAGLGTDAISHLLCPISDPRHVLVWHTGTVVFLMLAGWLGGTLWQHRRGRGWRAAEGGGHGHR